MLGTMLGRLFGRRQRKLSKGEIIAAMENAFALFPETVPEHVRDDTFNGIIAEANALGEGFEEPWLGIRHYLATNILNFARFGCVALPAPPEDDPFAVRGEPGVTGLLQPYAKEICRNQEDILESLDQDDTEEEFLDENVSLYLVAVSAVSFRVKATAWNNLRLATGDVTEPDWFQSAVAVAFGYYEDKHREALGIERVLEHEHPLGAGAADHFLKLLTNIDDGVEDPYAAWLAEGEAALSAVRDGGGA